MLSSQQPVVYDLSNGFVWYLQRQNSNPSRVIGKIHHQAGIRPMIHAEHHG